MRILAIETSCDETAAAVVSGGGGFVTIETNIVTSQAKLHEKYGGVFPEVASREHAKQIIPVVCEALGLGLTVPGRLPDFALKGIGAIAVTQGPGLIGSLIVGVQTAATLSFVAERPLIPVNHLAGHVYASFVADSVQDIPQFPLLALIVSGGHTMLVFMERHDDYRIIGQTRDDAAGEAFDKVAQLLGLVYPGGPEISRLAFSGDPHAYKLPVAFEKEAHLDFSFSGLKTAVLRLVQELGDMTQKQKANVAASFQEAVVSALISRTNQALNQYPVRHMILGGGVAANTLLRERLESHLSYRNIPVKLYVPRVELCTDNAATIGAAALFSSARVKPSDLSADPRLKLESSEE